MPEPMQKVLKRLQCVTKKFHNKLKHTMQILHTKTLKTVSTEAAAYVEQDIPLKVEANFISIRQTSIVL